MQTKHGPCCIGIAKGGRYKEATQRLWYHERRCMPTGPLLYWGPQVGRRQIAYPLPYQVREMLLHLWKKGPGGLNIQMVSPVPSLS